MMPCKFDDVYNVFKAIVTDPHIPRFYCSMNVSWKLAKAIDWLHGAIIEALTRPDTRVFYMLQAYQTLLSILSYCHEKLRKTIDCKSPYNLLFDNELSKILEEIMRG